MPTRATQHNPAIIEKRIKKRIQEKTKYLQQCISSIYTKERGEAPLKIARVDRS